MLPKDSDEPPYTHRVVFERWYMTMQEDWDFQESYMYCTTEREADENAMKLKALPRTGRVMIEKLRQPVAPKLVRYA